MKTSYKNMSLLLEIPRILRFII